MTIHAELHKLDKWVKAIGPLDSVHDAASYSLRNRLASVHQFFPRAAISEFEGVEDVHQLRVATRRVYAVLELYAELLPTKLSKLLRGTLKKIHRAAGAVRDLDVLNQRFRKVEHNSAKNLVKALNQRRSKMQLRLAKLYLRLRHGDRFLNQTHKLLSKIGRSNKPSEPAGAWMKMRWSEFLEQFYQSADVDTEDLHALHQFRITIKRLRYGLELLAPAFDCTQCERAYEFVERLQDRLGQLNDHVIACELFRAWNSKRNRVSRKCNLNRLLKCENEVLQKELGDFDAWWTPSLIADMREAFDQLAMPI